MCLFLDVGLSGNGGTKPKTALNMSGSRRKSCAGKSKSKPADSLPVVVLQVVKEKMEG